MTSIAHQLRRFGRDRRGGVLAVFGIAGPMLAVAVAAAVEYSSLASRRTTLQKAADAAALAGAQQLRLSNTTDSVVDGTVRTIVSSAAPTPSNSATIVQSAVADKRSSVQVTIRETVATPLGKLLSLPTMDIGAIAKAQISGTAKLCLLTLDEAKNKAMNLDKDSLITAAGCAVYSNSVDKKGIAAGKNAQVTASLICSAGGIDDKGAILDPRPTTDCPPLTDPLAAIARPSRGACTSTLRKVTGAETLWPGTYCKGLTISGTAQVSLMPGIYVFDDGPLIVSNTARISGQNVSLFFSGNAGGMRLDPDTTVSLTAPKSGPMAGFLMFEDRSVGASIPPPAGPKGDAPPPPLGSMPMRSYRITSNNAPTLLGTIYLPAGRLIIDASRPVGDRSAYTVIIARQLELNSGPNLYLNTDYGATDIPVPQGVGSRSGQISLTR